MKTIFSLLILFSLNRLSAQETTRFNHFLFTVPAGWKTIDQKNFFIISPPDLSANESLSYIFLEPVTETNFETVALQVLQDMATGLNGTLMTETFNIPSSPNLAKEISGKSFKGWEYYKCFGHVRAPVPNDPYSSIVYEINIFLVRINSRIERLVLMSKDVHDGAKESTTSRNPKYADIVRNFCFSLEFDDWKDSPSVIGKVTHKGISSVWSGLNYYINSQSVVFTSSLQKTYLIFFDNGQVYFNSKFPSKGLDELNTLIDAEWNPHLWGTYTFQNGSGTIKLPYATIPFSLNGNKLVVNYMKTNHDYSENPSPDNTIFNGTWCGSGEVYGSSACINFTSDGKFTDNGVVRALEHSLNDYYVATPTSGSGTYSIANNSIIFKFNTGFVFKTAFPGNQDNRSHDQISLGYNNNVFVKK